MDFKKLEIEHNKKNTILISLFYLIVIAGLGLCVGLLIKNISRFIEQTTRVWAIVIIVLLALCILCVLFLFFNQAIKLRYNIIFVADEKGICDYSRHIVLVPIKYSEIESIEYKGFLSDDVSDFRHLKINLKNKRDYVKKLNFIQRLSYYLSLTNIEITLFCGKAKIKEVAKTLQQNLNNFNTKNDENA